MKVIETEIEGQKRMEGRINFFAWGGGAMSHPPVPLIEDDCAA